MENNSDKKPCAVQKIETSQGFSVSYNNVFLYSKYNPSKNIITTIERLNLLPGTIILCCSPLLGYGLAELLQKLPENCLIVLCEADRELYDFTNTEGTFNQADKRVLCTSPAKLDDLPVMLYEKAVSGIYKRVTRLDMSAGIQLHKDYYDKLFAACSDSVMTFWKNRITLTKFGRRYSRNLFENLKNLTESKPITDYFKSIDKPILVFGAGESTQLFINYNKISRENYFILCADTALQPLLKNGIKPDGVFVEEAQSVITKAFIGIPKDIHIFAGLTSIPNIAHKTGSSNVSYFFTEYTKADFIEELKSKSFMPPANMPFGSVGLTTVYYALKFRKSENVPVYVIGLDFSYSIGTTHTKDALAHILRLITGNKLHSIANYTAAYGIGTEKINSKNGQTFITSQTLKSYAAMFKNFFSEEKNLYDAGETGIDLGLPHADMNYFVTNASGNDKNSNCHSKAEGRGNPHAKLIDEYLSNERKSLEYLRDLLTGKTELKDDELISEIKKVAEPREYLYLHFADGYKFSLNQSFLNRIRTELDFFLKFL